MIMLCVQCLAPENDHCGCVGEDGEDSDVFDAAEEILALRAENEALLVRVAELEKLAGF